MPEEILEVESQGGKHDSFFEKPEDVGGSKEANPASGQEVSAEGRQERVEIKYNEILSKVVPQAVTNGQSDDSDAALDAKSIAATVDEESKIQKLLGLASTKGVVHAVKVARSLKDYYALDRMHDDLVDKLYDGLLTRGLIQKD